MTCAQAAYVPDLALLISLVGCIAAGMIGMVLPVGALEC